MMSSHVIDEHCALLDIINMTYTCIHRAKSEISYVFYVDDRCRIGLIHMSATNPIDEI